MLHAAVLGWTGFTETSSSFDLKQLKQQPFPCLPSFSRGGKLLTFTSHQDNSVFHASPITAESTNLAVYGEIETNI